MPDEPFRQRRVNPADLQANDQAEEQAEMEAMAQLRSTLQQQAEYQEPPVMAKPHAMPPGPMNAPAGVKLTGNVPPQLQQMIAEKQAGVGSKMGLSKMAPKQTHQEQPRRAPAAAEQAFQQPYEVQHGDSSHYQQLVNGLQPNHMWEEVVLPSMGKFYDGSDGPTNGVIMVRPMTGEEEQILATPRFVKRGQAINMIFQRCTQGDYRPDEFLTIDRTYLLIFLRGISYTPEYDVEVKCPNCDKKFGTVINLSELLVEQCPADYNPPLVDVLPSSKYKFNYRLSRGRDETAVQEYRDRQLKLFGDVADDTLLYRTAMLVNDIEGLNDKKELQKLIKQLPINDVAYIRNSVTTPPFGVETDVDITCPHCYEESQIDLPLEANFFFPQQKKKRPTQV